MKSFRIAVVSAALIAALWWAVTPPRGDIVISAPLVTSERLQCPQGSRLEDKLCVCADGAALASGGCVAATVATGHGDRHVTTVDLRRQRRD